MSLYYVHHKHPEETCPAKDPAMGAMLLSHVSPSNAEKFGVKIQSDAVLDNKHTYVLIVEAQNTDVIDQFMQPFKQAGPVDILPASTCEVVVEREGC